jgi:hypothetical protein
MLRPAVTFTALLLLGGTAQAQTTAPGMPPDKNALPVVGGKIAVATAMTPAQKLAALEESLTKEVDRRTEAERRLEILQQENAKLGGIQGALAREKTALEADLARTRDTLTKTQRDAEVLRADYARLARTIGLSLPVIAVLVLAVLGLLVWMLLFVRKLAARVHDVPTLHKIHDYETAFTRMQDQLNAEKRHVAVLKERLAAIGIVDAQ